MGEGHTKKIITVALYEFLMHKCVFLFTCIASEQPAYSQDNGTHTHNYYKIWTERTAALHMMDMLPL